MHMQLLKVSVFMVSPPTAALQTAVHVTLERPPPPKSFRGSYYLLDGFGILPERVIC